jgi:hypothetical protein
VWKNRPFQKGLGTGLIAGALLLQVMISVQNTKITPPEDSAVEPSPASQTTITAQLVKEKADSLNLQVFDKGEKLYKQNELDDAVSKAAAAAKAEAESKAPAAAQQQVSVFITEGMSAANVADYLFRSGVITDKAAFEQTMKQNQLTSKIRVGLYTFNLNHNAQEVMTQITTPPPA